MAVPGHVGYTRSARVGGYLVTALGLSVLVGWAVNFLPLLNILPGRITMKVNTAISFLFAGLVVILLTRPAARWKSRVAAATLAAAVLAIGLITLLEYGLQRNLGIDQLLWRDSTQVVYPGRMAHITALNFCVIGLSLLLMALSDEQATWPQLLSLLTGFTALLAIIGYAYGVPLFYGSMQYTSMALHTGVGFLVVSGAILHCRPRGGVMSVITSRYGGGWLARHLIPMAVLVPGLLGGIYLHFASAWSDIRLPLAGLVVCQIILFVALIWGLALLLNRSEHEKAREQETLLESQKAVEQKYRSIFEEAIVGIFQTTPAGEFVAVNPAMARMLGYDTPQDLIAGVTDIAGQLYVEPERREDFKKMMVEQGEAHNFECQVYRKDGSKMWLSVNAKAVLRNGELVRYDGTFEDVTQRKSLEDQLRQAQKMEAVGRLAGGVAHDFNNAIGVIVGYGTLLEDRLSADDTARRYAGEIGKAGQRAASLTRQLLAFSRKQVIQPTVLDLNAVVTDMEKMLRRLIREDIDMSFNRGPELGRVKADVGQIEQILMNLVINARDAMPRGGKLVIKTANAELDETNLTGHSYAVPGHYVMLSVSDTGCGMDKKTQAHIFEPFFTTKGPGQGTGLGLSTVYGIVKQNEGYVWVYSEPGKGARFKVYLPRVEGIAVPIPKAETEVAPGGSETILLVEDDSAMRSLTRSCLENAGYTILDVDSGEVAIRVAGEYRDTIHLLLTDVVMQGMSGRQLAETLAKLRPEIKTLFMSGYPADLIAQHGILDAQAVLLEKPFTLSMSGFTTDLIAQHGILDAQVVLLEKPFTKEALLRKVRRVIDGEQRHRTATTTT